MAAADLPPQYLHGLALFNAGEFYECHEVLEELWQQAAGDERQLLHALIQAAAAFHHFQRGNFKGAIGVQQRALTKLSQLPTTVLQLDTQAFTLDLQRFFAQASPASNQTLPFPKIQLRYDCKT
ncbi:MAG: DUF309 domain-containing protein [Acidobacteria bacterium]|nr:DUF309 domain-containing protein [Acidobacteriota bacterium]MBI3421516.1 DUF309 domain-containing protein [Acidobacteriota bacterium]